MSYYFYLKAPRPMSDGKLPEGVAYGGQMVFHHGLCGPHTKQEVERIQSIIGGWVVSREYGDAYFDAIEKGVDPKDLFFNRIDPVKLKNPPPSPDVTPPSFEEVGYRTAIKTMAEAGFDWKTETGGSRKADAIEKAWEVFLES